MIERKDYWKTKIYPNLNNILEWAKLGMTDAQIARNLGIAKKTFLKYVEEREQLQKVLFSGRGSAEAQVENALFKKAIGYEYKEVTKERVKVIDEDGRWNGEYQLVVTKIVRKQHAPDTNAIIYWLEHRDPKRWHKIEEEEEEGLEIVISRKSGGDANYDDED